MTSRPGAADVVVIGAGVMGSATAWRLARRGVSVALIEQFEQGHERGSSHGGSRIFRFAYADPRYVNLAREAYDGWRELEDDAGCPILDITGGIDHGDPAELAPVIATQVAAGCAVEPLHPGEARERWPGMVFDEGVTYSPDTGRLRAAAAIAAFQERAAAAGASVTFGARVRSLDAAMRSVALESGEEVRAERSVVVTAGAWVSKVAESTNGTHIALPPLRVTREQAFHFEPLDGDTTDWPSFIHYRPVAHYGLLTPGEGVKVAEHGTGPETDPDQRSFTIDEIGRRRVRQYVERWLPGLDSRPVSGTTCLYTNTPDASFVVERTGDVVVGSPCSGHGFKFAPAIGRQLADLAMR